jgi:Ca-activated chloride channel family protein
MKNYMLFGIYFALILVLFWDPAFAETGRSKVADGNKLYRQGKYDGAATRYQDALLDDPTSPRIQFDMGNALYKKKDYQKALNAYQKALGTDDIGLQSQVYYNMGNSLYRAQKLPEAISAYERALKLNPNDQDAKYNLEYVRNKLKQNAQPQNREQQKQDQQQQQSQKQGQQKQDQKQQDQKQQAEQQQAGKKQEKQTEMSKEDAARLLDALKENQKDLKKQEAQTGGRVQIEKDW